MTADGRRSWTDELRRRRKRRRRRRRCNKKARRGKEEGLDETGEDPSGGVKRNTNLESGENETHCSSKRFAYSAINYRVRQTVFFLHRG